MLGGNIKYDVNIEKGKLISLDLSDASIVKGGSYYYLSNYSDYYTSNDRIGDYMFYQCGNLQDIVLPVGVTSIGDYAFCGCSSLTSIDIPEGVTSIGNGTFSYCSSLSQVYCYGTTPPTIDAYSFDGSKDGRTLYVPKGYLLVYQSSSWANYFGTITEME